MLIAACAGSESAPVVVYDSSPEPLAEPVTTFKGRTTIVKEGDNLYSIAFEAGFDTADVARWNNLNQEDILHVGQEIKLYAQTSGQSRPGSAVPRTAPSSQATQAVPTPGSQDSASANAVPKTTNVEVAVVPASPPSPNPSNWIWPTRGAIVTEFSAKKQSNGIAIAGESGTPVAATADGRVVYAGTGLIGFGRIIIVKHSEEFLSVYAHNSRIVVNEGDTVAQGQKIAEMGSTDADRVKLHFEIRRFGKPVDPLTYLPKV